jgi:PAS domain S-box-containing protein
VAHKLFLRQLAKATDPNGQVDLEKLTELVSAAYDEAERDHRRTDRSINLMVAEVDERNRDLREREGLLKDALDNLRHGLALYDAELRLDIFNPRYLEIYGLEPGDVVAGMTFDEVRCVRQSKGYRIYGEDGRPLEDVFSRGSQLQTDPGKADDDSIVVMNNRVIRVSRNARNGGGWVVMYADITERREAQRELAIQNELFRDALTNMGQGVSMYDRQDNLVVHNRRFLEINKLTDDDVKPGTKLRDVICRLLENKFYTFTIEERLLRYHPPDERQSFTDLRTDPDGRVVQVDNHPRPEGGWVIVHRDVTEREQARKELERSESAQRLHSQLFKDALDNIGYGLNVFDAKSRILVYNKQYLEMTGLTEADVPLGSTARDIINRRKQLGTFQESADDFAAMHREELRNNRFFEHRQVSTRGRIIHSTFYPRAAGGWVVLHRDVTEQLRIEVEKQVADAQAEQARRHEQAARAASEAKSAFLAVMSHEIRTPMNAIIGLSSALLESGLDGEQRHLADTIFESSNGLLRLLNDILDISKLEAGRVEFEAAPFSFAATIDHAVSIIKARAAEKGLAVRSSVDTKIPTAVLGDQARVRQVMLNLLTNALKFTKAGAVEIVARCLGSMDGKVSIECAIRDTGIGIADDKLDKLFNEFSQADASIHRRFGGTGLGLAICKRIVEQLGGEIRVESAVGVGSTFTFTLTLPTADPSALADAPVLASYDDFTFMLASLDEPLAVLLAEDNATNQMVFIKLMQSMNVAITIAANGREALELARDRLFDVVFMDMRMPEMDGLEATRAIRALGGPWTHIPIVALTANAFADDVRACREAGMDDFLAKPVRKKTLIATLAQLLVEHPRLTVEETREPDPAAALPVTPPAQVAMADVAAVCDRTAVANLIDEIDYDGARATLDIFLTDTEQRLALLRSLSTDADRKRIRDEAHTLKGASATFGLRQVAELSKTLEHSAPTIAGAQFGELLDRLDAGFAVARDEVEGVMAAYAPA